MDSGRRSLQLTRDQRAIAAAGALDSVRAEGLDPTGIEHALSRWVSGEAAISEIILLELYDLERVYGPPIPASPVSGRLP